MNVAINDIATDLETDVHGVQTAITLFLLTMAALMITGSKLTDIYGRKKCFMAGLALYMTGAILSALAPSLGILILGNSFLEGIGSALLIPPVYILTTVIFTDLKSRAKAFGTISGMGGIGAATGPLIGGFLTTTISWRASFVLQAVVIAAILYLSRAIVDPGVQGKAPPLDIVGAVLSALAMFLIVVGILQAGLNWTALVILITAGAGFMLWFFLHIRAKERAGEVPLVSTVLFHNRTSNLAMMTQNVQWLMLMGIAFIVTVFLQVVRGYSAIESGVIFTPATVGILLSSIAAGKLARRYSQKYLIITGFVISFAGIAALLVMVPASSRPISFLPGLFLIGAGIGVMLTSSVNVVQSSFTERLQGEISGMSRSVSNLGSSMGTAIAGTILVIQIDSGNRAYAQALVFLGVLGLAGLAAAIFLPREVEAADE